MKRKNTVRGYLLSFVLLATFFFPSIPAPFASSNGITASSTVTDYNAGEAAVAVDDALTLSGFDSATISSAKVLIRNKKAGDQLHYSTLHGITGIYATSGVLSLSGNATPAQYQAALRSVTFSTTSTNTESRIIDFAIGSGLYSSDTGHFYEYVPNSGITWDNAKTSAAAMYLYGRQGYLVTITSQQENDFVQQKASGIGWIGAKDINPYYGEWRWVTGPEGTSNAGIGLQFWSGYVKNSSNNVSTTVGIYANWANQEPNNSTNEYVVHIYNTDGKWNDFSPYNGSAAGYIVEYGGMTGDAPLTIQAEKTIEIHDVAAPVVSSPNLTLAGISNNGVTVSWKAASDGITTTSLLQYKMVYSSQNNIATTSDAIANGTVAMDWTAASLTNSITGLSPGTTYYFNVIVKDAAGNLSIYSTKNQSPPNAPTNVTAASGNERVTISFTPSSYNGGSAITGYTVTASPSGLTASGISSPITIAGLINGTGYTFTVIANNSIGESGSSSSSAMVTPMTVPSVPTNVNAAAGNGQATISFYPPFSSGGAVISNYIVTASPGGITASGIGSPITFTGLANGTSYTFTVVAVNSFGQSPSSSESAPVTPAVPPSRSRSVDPNAVTSTINGQSVQIGTRITETSGEQTQSVLNVNPTSISNLANTMPQGSTLVLPTYMGTAKGSKVGMTLGLVDQLFHQDISLQIDTGQIAYTLPANSIDIPTLLTKFEGNVPESQVTFDITISDVPTKMLEVVQNTAAKDEFAIVVPPIEFNVAATYNGQTVSVNQFSQHISREIALPAAIDPKKITTAIVIKEDGTSYHVPTDVYQKDGQWYARINSLTNSVYTLIYNEATFADTKGRWFEAPVAEAASRTILNGYADGTFRGTNPITRAEFAAMIVNTLGLDRVGMSNYPDVTAERWFYGVVSRASEYNVVSGRLDGSFDPNAYITRQEAMIMMQRAGEICGLVQGEGNAAAASANATNAAAAATAASSTAATLSNDYADQAAISTWAKEAVEYNLKVGLMKGSNGQLKPRENITRAEAAVTILRLLQKSQLIDPRTAV